jgi:hypothetical protein
MKKAKSKDRKFEKGQVSDLVVAASVIANNNKAFDGSRIVEDLKSFHSWLAPYVRERLVKLYGDKANL